MANIQDSELDSLQPEQMLSYVMKKVAEARQQHGLPGTEAFFTADLLGLMGIRDVMVAFEQGFKRFLQQTMAGAQEAFDNIMASRQGDGMPQEVEEGIRGIIESIASTVSYSSHVGLLNSGWVAAQELRGEYDVKLGIARKGLWLSHIFDLAGWKGGNVLVMRTGFAQGRISMFLEPDEGQFAGKRVLLLDNDMTTGQSVSKLARDVVINCGAAQVGVLTVYDHCSLSAEEFELGKGSLDPKRVLGRMMERKADDNGLEAVEAGEAETVFMSLPTNLRHVTKTHNLRQFNPEFRAYGQVRERLARTR